MAARTGSKLPAGQEQSAFGVPSERPAGPSPIDVHVGNRIRLRRSLLGMSQEKLGDALGLTFQQVQKYERGANRVSASRLHDLSRVLDVAVSFFYDELPAIHGQAGGSRPFATQGGFAEAQDGFGAPAPVPAMADDVFSRKETIDLVRAYYRIEEPNKRRKVLDLIRSMGPD